MPKHAKNKRRFGGLLRYVVLLLTGGASLGGWQFHDHPLVTQLLGISNPDATPREVVREVIRAKLAKVTENVSFRRSGTFEVKVARVAVDDGTFANGQTLDLQARVLRVEKSDDPSLIWSSKQFGDRLAVVGRDELVAGWDTRPFEVDWTPGDVYIVEVWNFRGLRPRKLFQVVCGDREQFPLRPGRVEPALPQGDARASSGSSVVFEATPISGARGGGAASVVAEQPPRGSRR